MSINSQIEILDESKNPTISINGDTYFSVSLLKESFVEAKEMIKFIKSVEKMVRSSPEYTNLIKYIKEELKLNFCSYLNALDTETVSIELHHTPYNLHQIVEIVILKNEAEGRLFNTFSIALEVIELHYKNYIGLVSLSKSIHELAHSDERFYIHKDLVLGDVDTFYNIYKDYMNEELRYVYKGWKKYSDENPSDSINTLQLFDLSKREEQLENTSELNKVYSLPSNISKVENIKSEDIPELTF